VSHRTRQILVIVVTALICGILISAAFFGFR
jgi:Na+-transporting NADH:ubiquinone oxidoreductase subunit NqrC